MLVRDVSIEKWTKILNFNATPHRFRIQCTFEENIKNIFKTLGKNRNQLNANDWHALLNKAVESFKLMLSKDVKKNELVIIRRVFILSFLTYYNYDTGNIK